MLEERSGRRNLWLRHVSGTQSGLCLWRAKGSHACLVLFVNLVEYLSGLHFEIFSLFNLLPNNLSPHYAALSVENNTYTSVL